MPYFGWRFDVTIPSGTEPYEIEKLVRAAKVAGNVPNHPIHTDPEFRAVQPEAEAVRHAKQFVANIVRGECIGSTSHPETPRGFNVTAFGDENGVRVRVDAA